MRVIGSYCLFLTYATTIATLLLADWPTGRGITRVVLHCVLQPLPFVVRIMPPQWISFQFMRRYDDSLLQWHIGSDKLSSKFVIFSPEATGVKHAPVVSGSTPHLHAIKTRVRKFNLGFFSPSNVPESQNADSRMYVVLYDLAHDWPNQSQTFRDYWGE